MTKTLNLKPINIPFQLYFSWKKRRDIPEGKTYWFTPSGNCKVYVGDLHNEHLSVVSDEDSKLLHKMMVENKTDILTDGRSFYTTNNNTIVKITNGDHIIDGAIAHWNANYWEAKDEYVEDIALLELDF